MKREESSIPGMGPIKGARRTRRLRWICTGADAGAGAGASASGRVAAIADDDYLTAGTGDFDFLAGGRHPGAAGLSGQGACSMQHGTAYVPDCLTDILPALGFRTYCREGERNEDNNHKRTVLL